MSHRFDGTQTRCNDGGRPKHIHRLSHEALETLNRWIKKHHGRPYPTKSEKAALQHSTGLDARQIDTWFANARRRHKDTATILINVNNSSSATSQPTDRNAANGDKLYPSDSSDTQGTPPDSDAAKKHSRPANVRIFHCTFCTDSFTSKYDWTRHETSVHLSLKRYICCPFSLIRTEPETGLESCVYCGLPDPTHDHIESHNHSVCQSRPPDLRIFSRKDHLRQHLRSVHECELLPRMNVWLLQAEYVNSRCGFCSKRFTDWSTRNTHIAAHYKQGSQMELWKGCRGLDSAVSAQVVAAMPSFLIGTEKQHQMPFSASMIKCRSNRYDTDVSSTASDTPSRWDALVRELQILVLRYSAQGFTISDEALRHHARCITYGSATVPASTAADHPEWLDTFKRAYCLDALPGRRNPQAAYDTDDLDVHHDLGLTMPYLQCQRAKPLHILFLNRGPVQKSGRRFSSIAVPIHKALPFETITGPWPDAGILGHTIVIRDLIFSSAVQSQIYWPLALISLHPRGAIPSEEKDLCWSADLQQMDEAIDIFLPSGQA